MRYVEVLRAFQEISEGSRCSQGRFKGSQGYNEVPGGLKGLLVGLRGYLENSGAFQVVLWGWEVSQRFSGGFSGSLERFWGFQGRRIGFKRT